MASIKDLILIERAKRVIAAAFPGAKIELDVGYGGYVGGVVTSGAFRELSDEECYDGLQAVLRAGLTDVEFERMRFLFWYTPEDAQHLRDYPPNAD